MDRWSRRWKAGEDNKDQLRKILDEVSADANHPKGSAAQLTGDFYAACTNVKAIDAAGIIVTRLLESIPTVPTPYKSGCGP